MPKAFLELLGIFSKLKESQHFDMFYQFSCMTTIQNHTRHVRNNVEKENTTILFMD